MAKILHFPPAKKTAIDHLAQMKQRRETLRALLVHHRLLPVDRHAIEVMLLAVEAAIARLEATAELSGTAPATPPHRLLKFEG